MTGGMAWYETQVVKDMMALVGGKALRGVMSNYFSSRIYSGKLGLLQVSNFLEASLEPEERRALIVTDEFTKRYVKKLTKYLDNIDMEYKVWSGAIPEVPIYTIDEGAKICEEFKPKVIFGIGGGSVMDTVKMVLVKYEKPDENLLMILPYFGSLGLRKKVRFWIAIPTTSGTGSEVTQAAVITDTTRDPPKKLEVLSDELFSDITILDPDFVKDMPPFLTMATGLDAYAHAVGAFVSNWGSPFVDALNRTAIEEIVKYLPRAYKYGAKDIEARSHMQMASLMAGIGFGNTITGIDHSLGHSFGKIFKVHHGLSVGMFLPYSIDFQYKVTDRWKLLCPIFNITTENKNRDDLFQEFIDKIKEFIRSLNGPTCVKEIENPKIEKDEYFNKLDVLVDYADNDAVSLTSYRAIDKSLYKKIYERAWDGRRIDF
ncbi:MAG: iron-containing alcohol dehydrogenase [Candidatus Lokiarchaeota archaeon]|nr:iron-containing alcohol dehydrogenase [Candidatus Lokiarchaeota archaeon]MBD3343008.1 iron-containing alcohol dehydrogenase [Candidatus Lokiarchaeota archaeon]